MQKIKVFCPIKFTYFKKALANVAEVRCETITTEKQYIKSMNDVNILIPMPHSKLRVTEAIIDAGRNLKMIQTMGAGYDHIDVEAATKRGIIVCNTGGVNAESVSELALALMLNLARHVSFADHIIKKGGFQRPPLPDMLLWGKTLGVIGLGNIGARTSIKARLAFNMKILAYDPNITPDRAELVGAELVGLEILLRDSDVITIHCSLNEETRGLIGENELALMKPTALLVNTARGGIIDEKALVKCLEKGCIGGVGLDVYEEEPLSTESPLRKFENAVLTPIIGTSKEVPLAQAVADNIKRFVNGKKPFWIINAIAS